MLRLKEVKPHICQSFDPAGFFKKTRQKRPFLTSLRITVDRGSSKYVQVVHFLCRQKESVV